MRVKQQSAVSHTPHTGDWTQNLGTHPWPGMELTTSRWMGQCPSDRARTIVSYSYNKQPSFLHLPTAMTLLYITHGFTNRPPTKGSYSSLSPLSHSSYGKTCLLLMLLKTGHVSAQNLWLDKVYRIQLKQKLPLQGHLLSLFSHIGLFTSLQMKFTLSHL